MKICTKCQKEKPLSEYYKCSAVKSGYKSYCKECSYKYKDPEKSRQQSAKYRAKNRDKVNKKLSEYYYKKKESDPEWYEAKKARENKKNRERSEKNRKIINEFKSQGCSRCGYNEHPAALDCHHVRDKKFSLGSRLSRATKQQITEELEKCIVLCSNCHRIEHYHTTQTKE